MTLQLQAPLSPLCDTSQGSLSPLRKWAARDLLLQRHRPRFWGTAGAQIGGGHVEAGPLERPHAGPGGTDWSQAHGREPGGSCHLPSDSRAAWRGRVAPWAPRSPTFVCPASGPQAGRPAEPEEAKVLGRGGGQPPLQTCLDGEGAGDTWRGTVGVRQVPRGTQVDRHRGSPGHTASLSRTISHECRAPGRARRVPCLGLSAWQHRPFPEGDGTPLEKHMWDGTSMRAHLNICSEGPERRHSGGLIPEGLFRQFTRQGRDRGGRAGPARR